MSNVIPLFPAVTDEHYEDLIMPALIEAMQMLWAAADAGQYEDICKISKSLLLYVYSSMETLNAHRRGGTFDDNKLPPNVAHAIDNLAADYVEAMAVGDFREFADKLRKRRPTKKHGN